MPTNFLNLLAESIETDITATNLISWTEANRTLKGKPWSWQDQTNPAIDFRYLIPIYADTSQTIAIKKARQMAVSEYIINKLHYLTDINKHTTALHVFPNSVQASKFSAQRLTPLYSKKESPKIYAKLKHPELELRAPTGISNVFHRQFINWSNLILSFIGGEGAKSTDARSVTADFVALDEAKDLPQDKMIDVIECMSASPHQNLVVFGTPDFPDTEFDRWFQDSDQHYWMSTCTHCQDQQIITIDNIKPIENLPLESLMVPSSSMKYYYACRTCGMVLDRTANSCQWVSQNPEGVHRGYHIPQLIAPWISADAIIAKKLRYRKFPSKFMNEVLAETWSGGAKPISLAKLLEGRIDASEWIGEKLKYISIGIDWGNQSHYVVLGANASDSYYLLDFGIFEQPQVIKHAHALTALARAWDPNLIIMDSGYGKAQNQVIFREFPEQAFACFTRESSLNPSFEIIDFDLKTKLPVNAEDIQYHVYINHTSLCDSTLQVIQDGLFKFKLDPEEDLIPGISELRNMLDGIIAARMTISDLGGTTKKKWVITKAHSFAATSYAILGLEKALNDNKDNAQGAVGFFMPH